MKPKYSQITNLQELEAAQRQLRRKIERKGKELSGRFENLQQDYYPANLLGMTARTTGSDVPILQVIRYLKKKIASL